MVTMAQSAANWRNTHIHVDRAYSLTSTQLQPRCVKSQLSYYRFWNQTFYFEGTWGRGIKPEYPEKTPDSLTANRYHIFRGKNPTSRTGLKP